MFEMTQIIYDQHSKMYSRGARQSSEQLLSGILYCAHCGSCFSRKKRNHHVKKDGTITDKGYVWACHIRDVYGTKGGCSGERIQVIEADCIEALKFEIKELKESNLDSFFKLYLQNKFKDIQKVNKSALEKKCNALNGELRLLLQAKRDGLLDDDLYTEQMKALNKEISEVKTTLSRLERITEEREHLLRLYKEYKETVQKIDVDNLTNADLKTIFYKIFVSYRKTAEGKKVPTLRFVYRFLDSTNDDILLGSAVNLHIYTNLYRYKEADSLEAD